MPTQDKHNEQYVRNKELLGSPIFDVNSSRYLDWVITITFYAAVHIIEKELAASCSDHSENHEDRKWKILGNKKLWSIRREYYTLYNQSRKARYHCCIFSPKQVNEAIELLNIIEKAVCNP